MKNAKTKPIQSFDQNHEISKSLSFILGEIEMSKSPSHATVPLKEPGASYRVPYEL
jgi:hypothetical protein